MFRRTSHLTDEELICFVDGEASPSTSDRIQKHLVTCEECRLRKASFEDATSLFAGLHHAAIDPQIRPESESHALLKAQMDSARKSHLGPFSRAALSRPWVYLYAAIIIGAVGLTALDRQGRFFKSMPPQPESRLLPDSGLTPGATHPVELADICPEQDSDLDPAVSPSIKQVVFQEYGIITTPAEEYQVDYLINPQLGGTDDVRNLWPEPYGSKVWNARLKDALEDRLHNMVCTQQIDLASAQRAIATDWIAAYKKYFHTANPA